MKKFLQNKRLVSVVLTLATALMVIPLAVFGAATDQYPVGVDNVLKFQGSTTVGPIIMEAQAEYEAEHSGRTIAEILQNGSGDGKLAITEISTDSRYTFNHTKTDIGMSSSDPGTGTFTKHAICRDGIVFIVNDSVTGIDNLTKNQLADIYNGRYTNWNQVYDAITGAQGPDMAIKPRMRKIGSGTRAAFSDSIKSSGHPNTLLDADPPKDLGATKPWSENQTRVNTDLLRLDENVQMQAAIDAADAIGQCGYVGYGFHEPPGGTGFRAVNIVTQYDAAYSTTPYNYEATFTSGSTSVTGATGVAWTSAHVGKKIITGFGTDSRVYTIASFTDATHITISPAATLTYTGKFTVGLTAFAPTGINIYAGAAYYPFARFLWLMDNPTVGGLSPNREDVTDFITWMKALDGSGQKAVLDAGFLKLIPDQDVNVDQFITGPDLGAVAAKLNTSGAIRFCREDVFADGVISGQDLGAVAAWFGLNYLAVP